MGPETWFYGTVVKYSEAWQAWELLGHLFFLSVITEIPEALGEFLLYSQGVLIAVERPSLTKY